MFFNSAESQFAFELSIFKAALTHIDRTYDLKSANVILIPFLPFISARFKTCHGNTHRERLSTVLRVIETIPRSLPIVIPCTCVMQKGLFGDVMDKLHAFSNIFQMTHSIRPYPLSISKNVIVVPYYSQMQASASCNNNGRIYWRGSPSVANEKATRVRKHIMSFKNHIEYDIIASNRGKCDKNSTRCINGFGTGRNSKEKQKMRVEMMGYQFCFIPEGDSPESSRLTDAINSLCIPVILSTRIPVLRSNVWNNLITIEADSFLKMNATTVLYQVRQAANISCEMRLQLRHQTSADIILHRLEELVVDVSKSHIYSTIGR